MLCETDLLLVVTGMVLFGYLMAEESKYIQRIILVSVWVVMSYFHYSQIYSDET